MEEGHEQPRSQGLSPFPPLSSRGREERPWEHGGTLRLTPLRPSLTTEVGPIHVQKSRGKTHALPPCHGFSCDVTTSYGDVFQN